MISPHFRIQAVLGCKVVACAALLACGACSSAPNFLRPPKPRAMTLIELRCDQRGGIVCERLRGDA